MGNAFDLHICYKGTTLQETIFPLRHSRHEHLYTETSRDHDSHDNTAHRAAIPALFLIYWATLISGLLCL